MTQRPTDAVFSHPDVHRPAVQAAPPDGDGPADPLFREPHRSPSGDEPSEQGPRTTE
ncbi:hypothetical protein ABZ816_19095 [Actinosynnema sp. NPDC047251]|uniref:hypothetical protein n=1 Tax=Saccharothrix espanaensis TaxID=103731 RepID=UPI0002E1F585|nr:hypothetical protein [Saccharothrix espanaensis]